MNTLPKISVVSPIYKGEKMLQQLVGRNTAVLQAMQSEGLIGDYEIILVNDASPDQSWAEIEKACAADKHVKGINLSRNFGQHYAITAGLSFVTGDWVVVMDCDLQDRPEEIPNLFRKAMEGYDTVLAQRVAREDGFLKRLSSRLFYAVLAYLTETKQDASVANFGIYHKCVIDAVLKMGDKMRYFPAQVQWVGFRKTYLPIKHDSRVEGKSSYNISRLMNLAFDTILSFSDKPMRLMVKGGLWMTVLSFVVAIVYLIRSLMGAISVMGYASLIISIWFLAGVIISLIGLVGLYVGKMFDTVKNRPVYLVNEVLNID